MAYITRLTRSSMLDVLGQDYIRTARAKGVPGFKVIFGHALKKLADPGHHLLRADARLHRHRLHRR